MTDTPSHDHSDGADGMPPALVLTSDRGTVVDADGMTEMLAVHAIAQQLRTRPHLVCHARAMCRRLNIDPLPCFDVLELFAFVHPCRWAVPTPRGLARALGLPLPSGAVDEALSLYATTRTLLEHLAQPRRTERSDPAAIATVMRTGGWLWSAAVLTALGQPAGTSLNKARGALAIWRALPEWSEHAPTGAPGSLPVGADEARERLASMLQAGGGQVEPRHGQADYASAITQAFAPRDDKDEPHLVLAEAGTGVGKTLGYLAPATLWAERNHAPVWVATYTRNLQTQIDDELSRRYHDPAEKQRRVVVRKGRENYLCLLNLEEVGLGAGPRTQDARGIGLMTRWAAATRDGDLSGADFPGWLADLIGQGRSYGLADRRGECVYAGCPHYSRCFIERSVRKARQAHVVIANHALVMLQAATDTDVRDIATRYVFDEGHHVFDAADSAFAAHLSGRETAELRRWLLGAEGGWGRARGLRRRAEDLIVDERELQAALDDILLAARCLPREGWSERVLERAPSGPTERFLALVHRQVYARAASVDGPYSLETATLPLLEELIPAADSLTTALDALLEPARRFAANLAVWLADPDRAEAFDQAGRMRLDALARSVTRRLIQPTLAWRDMLKTLITADPAPAFVDWFAVERDRGCDVDVGYYRHYIDPTEPFMATIRGAAHGMVITSATLTDQTGEVDTDWRAAETRTGALHLSHPAIRAHVLSPFDYGAQTKVLIVTDIPRDNMDQLAAAMGALFRASGGGGLGLFTAIGRLRAVHERLARPLEECGIPLLAQHVDGLDVATLIEIFRAEETACLLGTDAVRDGVDVPGRALRLICFDRVPWPRPDILHKARRTAFGGKEHDDRLVRLRLRQAFGRLVRRADDHGMFVMLDSRLPSRLLSAFPAGMVAERVPLGEAIGLIRQFCATA